MFRVGSNKLLVVPRCHRGLPEVHAKLDRRRDVRRLRVAVQYDLRQAEDGVFREFFFGSLALRLGALEESDAVLLGVVPD